MREAVLEEGVMNGHVHGSGENNESLAFVAFR